MSVHQFGTIVDYLEARAAPGVHTVLNNILGFFGDVHLSEKNITFQKPSKCAQAIVVKTQRVIGGLLLKSRPRAILMNLPELSPEFLLMSTKSGVSR